MKKLLLLFGILGTIHTIKTSAGGGAIASANTLNSEQEYRTILKRWDLEENVTMLDIFNNNKYLSMHTFKKLEEDLEKVENYNKQIRFNDEIAKRWLKAGINAVQQNIDANKNPIDWSKVDVDEYQHPIDWNQIEKESNRYISADPEFIKKHYQGVLAFIAQEGYDELIQGRCLFLDSTNTTEVTEQLQTQLYQDTVTHISVSAADANEYNNGDNAIKFIFEQRPGLTLIVNFTYNNQTFRFDKVPYSVKKLIISGRNINSIEASFLNFCNFKEFDVSSLSNVTKIEAGFLCYCLELTQFDVSSLSKVTKIKDNFLVGCSELTQFNASSLSNVTEIENDFLIYCTGLTQLDLSPLSKVTQIRDCFLYCCRGLKKLYLPPHLISVGNDFLERCNELAEIHIHKQLYEKLGGTTYFNNKRFPKLKAENIHFYNEEL